MMRPSPVRIAVLLVALASLTTPGAASAEPVADLPDLAPLAPFGVKIGLADGDPYGYPPRAIRFSVAVANRGSAPLDLLGVPTGPQTARALQCTSFIAERGCTGRSEVGDFTFHPQHAHWHLEAFATYVLVPLDEDGMPDDGSTVAVSDKVSFCLMDLERDAQNDDDSFSSEMGVYSTICTGVAQGISVGWMDIYGADLWGQQFLLADVPDGKYAIVVTVDPEGRLNEIDTTNNGSFTRISIEEGGTVVRSLG